MSLMLGAFPHPRSAATPLGPALPRPVAVVGLIQSERELAELSDIQAIQRWVCYLHERLDRRPLEERPKAFAPL